VDLEHQRQRLITVRRWRQGCVLNLADFVGQEHLGAKAGAAEEQRPIAILHDTVGAAGSATTLANVIATITKSHFSPVSAVSSGVADLRRVVEEAKNRRGMNQQRTVLFIDEIHRFNKAQQDAILPYVEDGTITLIGATTENPSFEVIAPLLSRSRVFTNRPMTSGVLKRALRTGEGLALKVELDEDTCAPGVHGQRRCADRANALELAALTTEPDTEGKRQISRPRLKMPYSTGFALRQGGRGALQPDIRSAQR
jgi:putative ATPase